MAVQARRRVKVYRLNSGGDWDDLGTGFVECRVLEERENYPHIVVHSEADPSKDLLVSKIVSDDIYTKQQGTLIVWNDGDEKADGTDLSLSFQEASGCDEIWNTLVEIQESLRRVEALDDVASKTSGGSMKLPPVRLGTIDEIIPFIQGQLTASAFAKQQFAESVIKQDFLGKLASLLRDVEDLDSDEDFKKLFVVFRDLAMINNATLLETLCADEFFLPFLAALEHDPDVLPGQLKHVEFMNTKATFKEVIPFEERGLADMVHLNFRLQYLKDVAMAKVLDEPTTGTLNSMIFVNNVKIVSKICTNEDWITRLFEKMKTPETPEDALYDALKLLSELADIARNLEVKNKALFHSQLQKNGLFDVLGVILNKNDERIRMIGMDLIINAMDNDPVAFRRFIHLQHKAHDATSSSEPHDGSPLLWAIIKRLHDDPHTGVKTLANDVINRLLDNPAPSEDPAPQEQHHQLLVIFYETYALKVFSPILEDVPRNKSFSDAPSLLRSLLCETLCNFISKHGLRARSVILGNNVLPRVLKLLNARDKFLHLAAIRVVRAVLMTSNRFYFTHIVETNLFEPIVKLFISNGSKYNLINSAIIDLFETIRKVQMNSSLLRYYMERFHDRLKDIDYVTTFQQLRLLAETGGRTPDTPDDNTSGVPKPTVDDSTREQYRKKILDEQHEDAWFSKDEDLPHSSNGFDASDKESDNIITAMAATDNSVNVASPTPPVPAPLTLERMEDDLFPEILQDLEKKRKRDDDDLDTFFEALARPSKKPKGNTD